MASPPTKEESPVDVVLTPHCEWPGLNMRLTYGRFTKHLLVRPYKDAKERHYWQIDDFMGTSVGVALNAYMEIKLGVDKARVTVDDRLIERDHLPCQCQAAFDELMKSFPSK
jgi:hypothetical protein